MWCEKIRRIAMWRFRYECAEEHCFISKLKTSTKTINPLRQTEVRVNINDTKCFKMYMPIIIKFFSLSAFSCISLTRFMRWFLFFHSLYFICSRSFEHILVMVFVKWQAGILFICTEKKTAKILTQDSQFFSWSNILIWSRF